MGRLGGSIAPAAGARFMARQGWAGCVSPTLQAGRPAAGTGAGKGRVLAGAARSLQIEYAIRDVVVPARELEAQGHKILRLNIGDPIAYGFRPPAHMVEALAAAARENVNGYTAS